MKQVTTAFRRATSVLVILLLCSATLLAGTTGKIAGRVTDGQTRDGLPGTSIVIEGTRLGAAADIDGYYYINNVPPGTYTLAISLVGYQKATVRKVEVRIDLTTTVDVKLNPTTVDVAEVVITAERPLVQKDLTSSSVTVSSEEIKLMPVDNVYQVINLQAGVVDGHFRGGRTNEVLYLVDGVSVTDPYNNGAGLTLENASIRQLEVISGTFNAEYGQAMSGVVNIVTQEGSSTLHGSLMGYVGDFFTTHTDVFQHLDHYGVPRTQNLQASLSGPGYFIDGLSFFATGRFVNQEGHLYGRRIFQPTDNNPYLPTGDGAWVTMDPSRRTSASAKIAYPFGSTKLTTSYNYEHGWNKYYSQAWAWNAGVLQNHYHTGQNANAQLTVAFSPSTYSSLKYTYNFFDYRGYLYQDPFDPRYVDPDRGDPQSAYAFRSGGNDGGRYERNTRTNTLQWTITSQVSKEHKITGGAEANFYRIYNHGYGITNMTPSLYDSTTGLPIFTLGYSDLGSISNQVYLKNPLQLSAYIQDKMEYEIMIINVGVRFDFFNAKSYYPADLQNPNNNPNFPGAGLYQHTTPKSQVSPRLGISFPITDQGIIHFSYGHFFQIPGFENLYTNPNYIVPQSSTVSTVTGNPDLDAQRNVNYEIGLQQVLFGVLSLDVTAYYRDIRDYLGMEIISTYDGTRYARFINRDYANARGFIISAEKRLADYVGFRIDYTYQIAEGNSSDPYTVYNNNQSDPPIETAKTVVPLSWDQRHTLNMTLTLGKVGDWSASFIGQYGSGEPYTEDTRVSQGLRFENGGTKPPYYNVDFRFEKAFPMPGFNINAFLWVYNLLDIKNELNVNGTTGRANVDLFANEEYAGSVIGLNTVDQYLNDPTSFSSPREVRLGLSVEF